MVQPKYSPDEALKRIKLMMEYDSSKTLDENKKVIFEQPKSLTAPTTLATAGVGAVGGALAAAGGAAALGATIGTGTFPVVGTAIGALVGLGLGALGYWVDNHDLGEEGFRKAIAICKAPGADKLVAKLSKSEVRDIAYKIEDAKGTWNDDEDTIVNAFMEIPTIADLCAVDKRISGGIAEFLDNLTDSPDEWRMFTRPIEGMIEDSEILVTPEEQEKVEDEGTTLPPPKAGGYKPCSGSYNFGCKADAIAKVQGCLGGLTVDGKFGPNTQRELRKKGYESFTDAEVDKICGTKPTQPEDEFTRVVDADKVDDILNT